MSFTDESVHVVSDNNEINKEIYFATLEGTQLGVLSNNPNLTVTFAAFDQEPPDAIKIKL